MSKNTTPDSIETMLTRSRSSHTVLLTSFRRSGQGVSTPVGMMAVEGKLYFMTPASTWKARRIAHTPHIQLALCTFGGKALSPTVDGVARRLVDSDAKRARKWICAGLAGWLVNIFFMLRYPDNRTAVYEVVVQPAPECKTRGNRASAASGGE
jgi:PPOX class probable F420-dependent enzyme